MKQATSYCIFLLFLLSIMPGCGRLVDWGTGTLYQGKQLNQHADIIRRNIRSMTVYDQFTTCAMFDALLLSNEIRTVYADLHARKIGKTPEQQKLFLRRQLEENNHFIAFDILSLYEVPLGDPACEWGVFLCVDGVKYLPVEVKAIDLSPEYEQIFGSLFTRFKVAYSIKFDGIDFEGNQILSGGAQQIHLYFRSMNKEARLTWDFDESGNAFISKIKKTGCYQSQKGKYENCDRG